MERTPDGFVFDVKAFRLFTQHQTPPEALPRDIRDGLSATQKKNLYYKDPPPEILDALWGRFRSALEPLRQSGKLGVVLFQFSPWFVFRPSSLDLIAACAGQLPRYRIAVEFRNKSWYVYAGSLPNMTLTRRSSKPTVSKRWHSYSRTSH